MARPDKIAAVAELTDAFRESDAAVLTEYRGLTVTQLKELRRTLGATVSYAVVKNTLTKIAARDAGVDAFDDLLQGPSAIAFVTGDPVEAAKGLRDFSRTHPLLVIKGGVLDGKAISADEIRRLADVEPREVLLAKLAGAMKASLSGAVALFAAPLSQAARTLEALRVAAAADPSILRGGAGTPAAGPAPAADERPAVPEEPAADEPPAADEGPAVPQEPAADEPPAADEAPAVALDSSAVEASDPVETSAADEASAADETPGSPDSTSETERPTAEDGPISAAASTQTTADTQG